MKQWITPNIEIEEFEVNDYVSTCYDYAYKVKLTCAIPGSSASSVDDGYGARNDHGICGHESTEIYVTSSGSAYETGCGVSGHEYFCPKRPISNIKIGTLNTNGSYSSRMFGSTPVSSLKAGGVYNATWTSQDYENGNGAKYTHYGRAKVTEIASVNSKPNHS